MRVETLLPLLVFLFPLAYSPGPGNAFFAAIGASRGLRAAVPALAGYHVATFVVTALIGLGMGVTVLEQPVVAKAIGTTPVGARPRHRCAHRVPRGQKRIGFWSGAIVLVLNPKAYYIIAVMFTQFLRPPTNDDPLTVLVVTLVFTLNNLVAFIIWALAGRALTAVFRSDRARRRIDYLFAATLIGVAIWMAIPLFV